MNLPQSKKRALWVFVAAVIATGSYFAYTAWQTQRGEAALAALDERRRLPRHE